MRSCCSHLLYGERLERRSVYKRSSRIWKPVSSKGGGVCCHLCERLAMLLWSLPFHFRSCLRTLLLLKMKNRHTKRASTGSRRGEFGDNELVDEAADERRRRRLWG